MLYLNVDEAKGYIKELRLNLYRMLYLNHEKGSVM